MKTFPHDNVTFIRKINQTDCTCCLDRHFFNLYGTIFVNQTNIVPHRLGVFDGHIVVFVRSYVHREKNEKFKSSRTISTCF